MNSLLTVILSVFNLESEVHWPPWLFLELIVIVTIILRFYKKIDHIFLILFTYLCLHGLLFFSYDPFLGGEHVALKISIKYLVSRGLLDLVLMLILMYFAKVKTFYRGFTYVHFIHGPWMIWDDLTDYQGNHGLFGNHSIGASYLVVSNFIGMYSFKSKRAHLAINAVTIVALIASRSAISFGAYLVSICAYLWIKGYRKIALGIGLGAVTTAPFLISDIYSKISRYELWPYFINYWRSHFNILIGSGHGSFKFYGPNMMVNKFGDSGTEMWLWAHNDWLEFMFEFGIIGLVLMLFTWGILLRKSYRVSSELFCAILCFGLVMFGNYPWQIAMMTLMGLMLIKPFISRSDGLGV